MRVTMRQFFRDRMIIQSQDIIIFQAENPRGHGLSQSQIVRDHDQGESLGLTGFQPMKQV